MFCFRRIPYYFWVGFLSFFLSFFHSLRIQKYPDTCGRGLNGALENFRFEDENDYERWRMVKSETRRDAEILVRNPSPRLFGEKFRDSKKVKANHEKTRLRDLSKTLTRFRDPSKIFRDPRFSRYHSPPLLWVRDLTWIFFAFPQNIDSPESYFYHISQEKLALSRSVKEVTRFPPCFRHHDIRTKTRSRMTTVTTFSRQNDAGSRSCTT